MTDNPSVAHCPKCGAKIEVATPFCGQCGASLAASESALPQVLASEPANVPSDASVPSALLAHPTSVGEAPAEVAAPPGRGRSRGPLIVIAVLVIALVLAGVGAFAMTRSSTTSAPNTVPAPEAIKAAVAVINASDAAWIKGQAQEDCTKYEGIGPNDFFATVDDCVKADLQSLKQLSAVEKARWAEVSAVASDAEVLPENVVVVHSANIQAIGGRPANLPADYYWVARLTDNGWRFVGSGQSDGKFQSGYIPPSMVMPAGD